MFTGFSTFIRNIPLLFTIVVTNSTPHGSVLGIYLRSRAKKVDVHQLLGVQLAGFAFFAAVVMPQSGEALSSFMIAGNSPANVVVLMQSADVYQWPLKTFGISQEFSIVHPGMDLTDPIGTPIFPIAEGTVAWIQYLPYGYGSHMFVRHDNNTQSLYAHLSRIDVYEGDRVTKQTQLGLVGVTGWTTGSHLHFEVYQNYFPTNPVEILPEIRHIPAE